MAAMEPAAPDCPRCGAPRVAGPECPRCGVIYAKAKPRPEAVPGAAASAPAPDWRAEDRLDVVGDARGVALFGCAPAVWTGDADAALRELRIQLLAPPLALLVLWALVSTGAGQLLVRTFLSMWVHELGHAAAAWLCGHGAIPGPWRTWSTDNRQVLVILMLGAGFSALVWYGLRARRPALVAAGAAGAAVQFVCTLLPEAPRRAFITFAGDGGAMVLGAAMVATIWSGAEGRLGRGALRWGFLVIGAAGFVDAFRQWVRAWRDPRELPLGRIEGVGLSDASRLIDVHGWAPAALSRAYVLLGFACLAALAVGYALALARARARVVAARALAASEAMGLGSNYS
jgi:hypothetical protein